MTSDAARVLERLVAAQNAHDLEAFVACFAPDYRSEQPLHPDRAFVGSEQVRKNWTAMFDGFPDFHATLVASVVDGDVVWAEFEWRGSARDGTKMWMRGPIVFTIRARQIAAARLYVEPVDQRGISIDQAVNAIAGRR